MRFWLIPLGYVGNTTARPTQNVKRVTHNRHSFSIVFIRVPDFRAMVKLKCHRSHFLVIRQLRDIMLCLIHLFSELHITLLPININSIWGLPSMFIDESQLFWYGGLARLTLVYWLWVGYCFWCWHLISILYLDCIWVLAMYVLYHLLSFLCPHHPNHTKCVSSSCPH